MSYLSRLAGALLLATEGRYYVIGHFKEPCNFAAEGFEPPPHLELAPAGLPVCQLLPATTPHTPRGSVLHLSIEGIGAAQHIAERLLVHRNGSVSERLWRLLTDPEDTGHAPPRVDAAWFGETPKVVWDIVRDTVLRCS